MMYFKINETGCSERKGLCQVRYDLYLDDDSLFCCHFCQFEPDVTDEEILYVGELVLDMVYKNKVAGNVGFNKNMPVVYSQDEKKKEISKKRVDAIRMTNFLEIKTNAQYKVK